MWIQLVNYRCWSGPASRPSPEHPRVGGEDSPAGSAYGTVTGAPPHRRRGLRGALELPGHLLSTPASAGRTPAAATGAARGSEHPRIGGEDWQSSNSVPLSTGAPPRRRGRLAREDEVRVVDRSTPASAGKTCGPALRLPRRPEHPRVGGEDTTVLAVPSAARGAPPRRRGRPGGDDAGRHGDRSTPASAGKTRWWDWAPQTPSEHPRVGGEDYIVPLLGAGTVGAPPRRRGRRVEWGPRHTAGRSTPASAGKTRPCPAPPPSPAEHPRVGGEDSVTGVQVPLRNGAPPRRRGRLSRANAAPSPHRSTPASAGKTEWSPPCRGRRPEHPRVGGEDPNKPLNDPERTGAPPRRRGRPVPKVHKATDGTPPRRRGGLRHDGQHRPAFRNTPASAGRTAGWARPTAWAAEHPRVGGEDSSLRTQPLTSSGTPPRRRGGLRHRRGRQRARRNTPASAGRTLQRSGPGVRRAEHPRVGGEDGPGGDPEVLRDGTPPRRRGGLPRVARGNSLGRNTPASAGRTRCGQGPGGLRRNTPASAGRTSRPGTGSRGAAEHPRVGGEDEVCLQLGVALYGTPPRRRGGLTEERIALVVGRNTPASAGRTCPSPFGRGGSSEHPRVGGEDTS